MEPHRPQSSVYVYLEARAVVGTAMALTVEGRVDQVIVKLKLKQVVAEKVS